MKTLVSAAAIGIVILCTGCARQGGTYVTDEQINSFQDGTTTMDQVIARLGRPLSDIQDSSGMRTLGYSYTATQVSGATFIPVVGAFAGGASAQSRTVIFQFDGQGILRKHTTLNSQFNR